MSGFKEVGSETNEAALASLSGERSLLDGRLIGFCLRSNAGLEVELTFEPARRVGFQRIRLEFRRVVQFQISHSEEYIFGNIESIKLQRTPAGLYYISLDPDTSISAAAATDQDCVLGESITAFFYRRID